MSNKKYLLYPYTKKSFSFIKGLLAKDTIFDVISPKGLGLQYKDIGYSVNKKDIGQEVKLLKDIQIKDYQSLIISSHINKDIVNIELESLIEESISNNLEIIILSEEELMDFKGIEGYKKLIKYDNTEEKIIRKNMNKFNELNLPFYTSRTPAIYIGGMFEYIDNLSVSLELKIRLENKGYNVKLISNEKDTNYFDGLRYPEEFMSTNIDPVEQIIILNRFIQGIEYIYSPDIILLHQPKGMLMYNSNYHNTFGIYTYLLSQSIRPDYLIFNIPVSLFSLDYIDKLNDHFKSILGLKVDIFNITNEEYEIGNNKVINLPSATYVNEREIEQVLSNYSEEGKNIYNLNDKIEFEKIIEKVIHDLSGGV